MQYDKYLNTAYRKDAIVLKCYCSFQGCSQKNNQEGETKICEKKFGSVPHWGIKY